MKAEKSFYFQLNSPDLKKEKQAIFDSNTSIVLDLFRIISAFVVMIHHCFLQWGTGNAATHIVTNNLSHGAVVVFFVLSGYLIGYTTTNNNRGPKQYAIARLSRLYSVTIPAIIATLIIEVFINYHSPEIAREFTRNSVIGRYFLSLFFCNEIGILSAAPPVNGPLWSLSYEFWYYLIFGLFIFIPKKKIYLIFPVVACIIAGPKILLLFPIWLMGLGVLKLKKTVPGKGIGWYLFFIFLIATITAIILLPEMPFHLGVRPFFFSNRFITDWITGVLFSLTILFIPAASKTHDNTFTNQLRKISDASFPLYILHYPTLILWRSIFGWNKNDFPQMLTAMIVVALLTLSAGVFLDSKRKLWITYFTNLINSISRQYQRLR